MTDLALEKPHPRSGPTRATPSGPTRWQGRPLPAAALRVAIVIVPIAASIASSVGLARVLPGPRTTLGTVGWWVLLLAVSTLVVMAAERVMRKALPLAALLKVTMVFPDRAPSRMAVARRAGGVKHLEERIAHARAYGVDDEPVWAAGEILGLVALLNAHDRLTRGHSERVRALAEMIAQELRLEAEDIEKLRWSSLLHDVGKIHVHPDVLNKTEPLTDADWAEILRHPEAGARLARPLQAWLGEWSLAIEQHHERFDGDGYPHQLAGHEISFGARIVAVADAYDTMVSTRAYKKGLTPAEARAELARCAGQQFDPVIVRAFLNISLGRLRWAMGPLSWMAQTPVLSWLRTVGEQVAVAGTAAAGVAASPGRWRPRTLPRCLSSPPPWPPRRDPEPTLPTRPLRPRRPPRRRRPRRRWCRCSRPPAWRWTPRLPPRRLPPLRLRLRYRPIRRPPPRRLRRPIRLRRQIRRPLPRRLRRPIRLRRPTLRRQIRLRRLLRRLRRLRTRLP